MEHILEVRDLRTHFVEAHETVRAVDGVSFALAPGRVLGIVGESGCGKSVTALSLMRLVAPPGMIVGGQVLLHDDKGSVDLLTLPPSALERIRGDKLSMIFQDPMTSLNPVLRIGFQLTEPLKLHRGMTERTARARAVELLERVGIPEASRRMDDYPHQFSGGMRQRVMIAMAVACGPRLLIADEPTTALDVTIQAGILELLRELRSELGTAIIIITHDLGVVAQLADEVAVMYAGTIVEHGPTPRIFAAPEHPYTRALLAAVPRLKQSPARLQAIGGAPPSLATPLAGCAFEPRCPLRVDRCSVARPPLRELQPRHTCACWVAQEQELLHA